MSKESRSQQETGLPAVNPKALSLIFDWIKDTPERQLCDAEYLNSKVLSIFTAASVLIGFVGFSNAVPPGATASRSIAVTALVVVALVTYLAVILVSFLAIRTTAFSTARLGEELWLRYWMDDEDTIKHGLIAAIGQASHRNKKILRSKARSVKVVLIFTGAEALFATRGRLTRLT